MLLRFLFLILSCGLFADPLVVGYYNNTAQYRPGAGACLPSHLQPVMEKLDVLNYAFLQVGYQSITKPIGPTHDGQIYWAEWNDEQLLKELRQKNPLLKILISVRVPEESKQTSFITSAFEIVSQLDLQGLDIVGLLDLSLLKEFRTAIEARGSPFILTSSVGAASAEDLKAASPFVDWFNLLPDETLENRLQEYMKAGIPKDKLVVGLSTEGTCPETISGYYTKKPGCLAYYEIIDGLEGALFAASQVRYESPESAFLKGRSILQNQLRGALILTLDTDNFMDPLGPFALTEALIEGMKP